MYVYGLCLWIQEQSLSRIPFRTFGNPTVHCRLYYRIVAPTSGQLCKLSILFLSSDVVVHIFLSRCVIIAYSNLTMVYSRLVYLLRIAFSNELQRVIIAKILMMKLCPRKWSCRSTTMKSPRIQAVIKWQIKTIASDINCM